MKNIQAVIFDMDGVLIDSEPLWRQAMIAQFNAVGLPFDDNRCMLTTGLRIDEVVNYWYQLYPWPTVTPHQLIENIVSHLIHLIQHEGVAMPGTMQALDICKQQHLKIAIASSSNMRIISAVVHKLGMLHQFDIIHSAEFESHGKPHPAVFLATAHLLHVLPQHCLVIEDSVNGLIAAKAAGMTALAVPEPHNTHNPKMAIADFSIPSLTHFTWPLPHHSLP